jgi:hypothetical protein
MNWIFQIRFLWYTITNFVILKNTCGTNRCDARSSPFLRDYTTSKKNLPCVVTPTCVVISPVETMLVVTFPVVSRTEVNEVVTPAAIEPSLFFQHSEVNKWHTIKDHLIYIRPILCIIRGRSLQGQIDT